MNRSSSSVRVIVSPTRPAARIARIVAIPRTPGVARDELDQTALIAEPTDLSLVDRPLDLRAGKHGGKIDQRASDRRDRDAVDLGHLVVGQTGAMHSNAAVRPQTTVGRDLRLTRAGTAQIP